jgi:predicted ribosome quality control (RQC) complex YloA/Tae2 family protein
LHKKEFTSFDVAAIVRELREAVLDSRVNNVYQLDAKTLLLKLHKAGKPAFRLVMEAGRRLHLTAYSLEKPLMPPAFCMALRKHLRNAWLTNVEQHEFERVVVVSFRTRTNALKLVLEFFGDGNIILVDENGQILQALIYKRMRDRNIVRDEVFHFAPSTGRNPFKTSKEELLETLRSSDDVEVVRAVARFLSIGGVYAEEILSEAAVGKTKPCNALSNDETEAIFNSLQDSLTHIASGKLEPCIVLDEAGGYIDVAPFRLKRYQVEGLKLQPYDSFNEALDEFYVRISTIEQAMASVEIEELEREAARLKRIIVDQEKTKTEAETKAEQDKRVGDVIYAHIGDLQALMDKFSAGKQSGKEWKVIVSEALTEKQAGKKPWVFLDSFDAKGLFANVSIDGLPFSLNLRRTLFENAADFYERGKRAKQKLEGIKTAMNDSYKKLEEVEAKVSEVQAAERGKPAEAMEEIAKRKVKHKEWFEKFRWFISSDGFLIIAGKDATSNEVLIKKHTENRDVVFHADIVGAPFVVIKTEGKEPSEQCLREAAEFAAAHSRGWREGFGSVDVYRVEPEQLTKAGPSGESVGHGAFVVRGGRNWLRGVALKLAVGVTTEKNGAIRYVGGPVDSVKAKTEDYVKVVPGDLAGKELFKRVLGALARKMPKEAREKILKASVEEIRDYIPFGKGNVVE